MIDKRGAFDILSDIVRFQRKHQDYKRVTEYATLLKKLITGEGMDDLLRRFTIREDDELFKQRVLLTQHITKPVTRAALKPLNKIPRVTPTINEVAYEKGQENKLFVADVENMINTFWGGNSLDAYLEKHYPDLCGYDPNAFLLTLFSKFDHTKEKPVPYTVVIPSSQAVYYEYFNNKLQYLVLEGAIKVPHLTGEDSSSVQFNDGFEYQIYVDNDSVCFTQMDINEYRAFLPVNNEVVKGIPLKNYGLKDYPKSADMIKFDDSRIYMVRYYTQKSGRVPAIRIGCMPDPLTDGRTCLSILDSALPYLMKTVTAVSELDLSIKLHVFPQKLIGVPKCTGAEGDICRNGENRAGTVCTACGGSGKQSSVTTTQETIEITLPDELDEGFFDLSKLVHYVTLPIDILNFQTQYIDSLKIDILKAIYNSDVFTKDTIVETATKKNLEMDSVYDTLNPYATQLSAIRMHQGYVGASYIDRAKGLILKHQYPRDFKFKTLSMRLEDLKQINESNSPDFLKEDANADIANIIYQDRPKELIKQKVLNKFSPFDGMSESEAQWVMSNKNTTRNLTILHCNKKSIFIELEEEHEILGKNLYEFPFSAIKEKVDAKVAAIIAAIDSAEVSTAEFMSGKTGLNVGDDDEDETGKDSPDELTENVDEETVNLTEEVEA